MQSKTNVDGTHSEGPVEGLEYLGKCPVCGSESREILHEGLTDKIFFSTPSKWNMYRCETCSSAYLDPRPTVETIGLYYQNYFTHDEALDFSALSFREKLRRRFANGYRNYRYGTRDYPATIFGILAAILMPNGRAVIDSGMRHLPKVKAGQKMLDIGCGNGGFLLRARSAGWDVTGVDFDDKAVAAARSLGLDVRLGGIETLDTSVESFDVITLAHVIEHVHHPVEVLQACYHLLKPGGFVWLETPNIASVGHQLFGTNWRGLEPPRHLVLFTLESMKKTLEEVGFVVKVQPYRPLCRFMFDASTAIEKGFDPYSESRPSAPLNLVRNAEKVAKCNADQREFITVKAWKE